MLFSRVCCVLAEGVQWVGNIGSSAYCCMEEGLECLGVEAIIDTVCGVLLRCHVGVHVGWALKD